MTYTILRRNIQMMSTLIEHLLSFLKLTDGGFLINYLYAYLRFLFIALLNICVASSIMKERRNSKIKEIRNEEVKEQAFFFLLLLFSRFKKDDEFR